MKQSTLQICKHRCTVGGNPGGWGVLGFLAKLFYCIFMWKFFKKSYRGVHEVLPPPLLPPPLLPPPLMFVNINSPVKYKISTNTLIHQSNLIQLFYISLSHYLFGQRMTKIKPDFKSLHLTSPDLTSPNLTLNS